MKKTVYDFATKTTSVVDLTADDIAGFTRPTALQLEQEASDKAKAALAVIDLASIRSIREYIVSRPDAPHILKDREAAAAKERVKVKP